MPFCTSALKRPVWASESLLATLSITGKWFLFLPYPVGLRLCHLAWKHQRLLRSPHPLDVKQIHRLGTFLNNRGWCSPPSLDNLLTGGLTRCQWFHRYKKRFHTYVPSSNTLCTESLSNLLTFLQSCLELTCWLHSLIWYNEYTNQEVKNVPYEDSHLAQLVTGIGVPVTCLSVI